jgi:hypothetical protein
MIISLKYIMVFKSYDLAILTFLTGAEWTVP